MSGFLASDEIVIDGRIYRPTERVANLRPWRPSAGAPACGGADGAMDADRDHLEAGFVLDPASGTVKMGLRPGDRFRVRSAVEVAASSSGPVSPELSTIFGTPGVLPPLETVDLPPLGMVDWLRADWSVPECPPLLRDGSLLRLDESGEIVREVRLRTRIRSSETSIGVMHHAGRLHFDGNPLKWMTNQNCFGTWNLEHLFIALVRQLSIHLGMDVKPFSYEDVNISRLDLTQMVPADKPDDAKAVVAALGGCLHSHLRKSSTYMLGEGSNWFRIKWYHKGTEIRDNKKQNKISSEKQSFYDFIDRFWRFEIELHRLYLKKNGLNKMSKWVETPTLFGDTMLKITDNLDISLGNADPIPPSVFANKKDRMLYRSWFCGDDIFEGVPKNTRYRWRRHFLSAYGIDLFLHPATIDRGSLNGGQILSFAWGRLRQQMESTASLYSVVQYNKAVNY